MNKNKKEVVNDNFPIIKLLLIGDQAVGKSSLMFRYANDSFNENLTGTTGLDLKKKIVNINNITYKILIYDTAGHERYRQFAKSQMKQMNGIMVIFDLTDKTSFNNVNIWMKSVNETALSNTSIILIGNKIDLKEKRVIEYNEGLVLAESYNTQYYETSAYTNEGINMTFQALVEKCVIKMNNKVNINSKNDKEKENNIKKSKCVCG